MRTEEHVRNNKEVHDLLMKVIPGVYLASAAYSDSESFPTQMFPVVHNSKLIHVDTPEIFNDTQVHVALVREWDPEFYERKTGSGTKYNIAFSFRGTEPWQACDWLADLNYIKREIKWWTPEGGQHVHAHAGFLQGVESVTEYKSFFANGKPGEEFKHSNEKDIEGRTLDWAVKAVIKDYNDSDPVDPPKLELHDITRVVVVGHSLGGAMATLGSVWARYRLPKYIPELKNTPVTCITTGCPRTGDYAFSKFYNKAMEEDPLFSSYRVVNNCDVVPSVPFYNWGFAHVGKPIWLCKKFNNWAVVYLTLVEPPPSSTKELISRPYGYSGSVFDHFEWHYNAAIAQAAATTITQPWDDFEAMEPQSQKALRSLVSGTMSTLSTTLFSFIAFAGVMTGKAFLELTQTSSSPIIGRLYRLLVNFVFFYFTVPMYILTHISYYMGL
eukprot:jgi/Botrbrau1/14590/Bobra.0312s0013.1